MEAISAVAKAVGWFLWSGWQWVGGNTEEMLSLPHSYVMFSSLWTIYICNLIIQCHQQIGSVYLIQLNYNLKI